uniref:ShKT domain-containing protein n=1 Tax=Pelagomonas calceolata TaxID=35677 RepID=A0A7S4EE32_9STRA|mmetsp:Transcript_4927/g.11663  ORF Transcript_4927/g.11663 Transcript_4927/m.11663 type:complete len:256 (-) Transcript_4927:50-817(-)
MKWPATRRRSAARGVFIILPAPRAGGALIIISVTASALSPVRVPTGRAASDDGWAAADACACACAEVLVATTLPSRRRLAEAARAPQAIDEDARRPGVDCTSTSCVDDATWCYGSCSPNDCAYVAQKLKRCKAKNTDGVRTALEACPLTCGTCSAPPTPTREPTHRPAPEATPGPTPGPAPRAPSPTPHPTPTPYHPTPTYAPSASCADDPTWSYGTKASNTCAYVAHKLKRCKAKNTDGVRTALEACPKTCRTC